MQGLDGHVGLGDWSVLALRGHASTGWGCWRDGEDFEKTTEGDGLLPGSRAVRYCGNFEMAFVDGFRSRKT